MQAIAVGGRFVNEKKEPIAGRIVKFTPNKIWIIEDGQAYATYAPEVMTDEDGRFCVELTRTDQAEYNWHYTVECPMGKWTIHVEGDKPRGLAELLPKRFTG